MESLQQFISDWLNAWSADVHTLLEFYADDCVYADPGLEKPLRGKKTLHAYFKGLLRRNPDWLWKIEELYETPHGCVIRWSAKLPVGTTIVHAGGMDIVELDEGLITRNEVYFDRSEWLRVMAHRRYTPAEEELFFSMTTERLQLRPYTHEDAGEFQLLVARNRDSISGYFPGISTSCRDLAGTQRWIVQREEARLRGELFSYAVRLRTTHTLIGHFALRDIDWSVPKAELSYWIDHEFRRNGYLSEIIGHISENLPFHRLTARIVPDNTASRRLLERNDFVNEGLLHADFRGSGGTLYDILLFARTKNKG